MGISLDQYRASIGGFKPPGLLLSGRSRRSKFLKEIWGKVVGERVGKEGRKLWMPLVNILIGFLLVATWFFLIRHVSFVNILDILNRYSMQIQCKCIVNF